MRLALCNEVIRHLPFAEQCRLAAALGYDGLEVAPFTLAEDPTRMSAAEIAGLRRVVEDHGLSVVGLHWLLVAPTGLSITAADTATAARTGDVIRRLIDLCAGLGGQVMIHGSPKQRALGDDPVGSRARAVAQFAAAAAHAGPAGIAYCIEPLSRSEADFINTLTDAADVIAEAGEPALRTMIDSAHAAAEEAEPLDAVASRWLPTGLVAHVQLADRNRRVPGQGGDRFGAFLAALRRGGYAGALSIEPMDYHPDGAAAAAFAAGYVRGLLATPTPLPE